MNIVSSWAQILRDYNNLWLSTSIIGTRLNLLVIVMPSAGFKLNFSFLMWYLKCTSFQIFCSCSAGTLSWPTARNSKLETSLRLVLITVTLILKIWRICLSPLPIFLRIFRRSPLSFFPLPHCVPFSLIPHPNYAFTRESVLGQRETQHCSIWGDSNGNMSRENGCN